MKSLKLTALLCLFSLGMSAQPNYSADRQQEKLDRGLTAFNTGSNATYITWRYFESEKDCKYQLYRNGQKMVETQKTSHVLPIKGEPTDKYLVKTVDADGNVLNTSTEVSPNTSNTLKVALTRPGNIYTPNDISVGDVDKDGAYELFVKWDPSDSHDNSQQGNTSDVIIDCYKMDGTRLWSVNLGPNIRAGAHYTQFLVYDFDGDGIAEMMCKTAPGSKDGEGNYVTAAADDETIQNADNTISYRNSNGYVNSGPEYLTVFSGQTGKAIHTIWYNPNRAMTFNQVGSMTNAWGDSYGGRCDRYNACVAYLDGLHPTAIFNRGYYTQAYFWAVDYQAHKLVHRWLHASVSNTTVEVYDANWNKTTKNYSANTCGTTSHYTAYGNGNHNISVGDYDGDGKDEVTFGSAAIDDDGQLMYAVGYGHGDAIHISDLIPSRPGLEVFHVHEESPYGWDLHDAKTGEVIWSATGGKDNGRGMAADLIASNPGFEFSSSNDRNQRSATTGEIVSSKSSTMNFRIYWDGTLQDNLLDGGNPDNGDPTVTIQSWSGSSFSNIASLYGYSCNSTKQSPNLSADIFGDWREEVILHDDANLYIYSSPMTTQYKVPCLMTDHIYRMGIVWQQASYNQPPHLGYYLPDTAIDMSNAEETLFYDPSDLANEGQDHTEAGTATIVWAMNSGADITNELPTIESSINGVFIGSQVTLGSQLTANGTKTNSAGQTQTVFRPTAKASAASDDNAINMMLTLKEGYEFAPTAISVKASRYGTNGGTVLTSWVNGDGTTFVVAPGVNPERSANESNGTTHEPYYTQIQNTDISAAATTNTFGVRLNVYGLDTTKDVGFCDLHIEGKLYRSGTTGIRNIGQDQTASDTWFTLQGVRIDHPSKGLYIHQGKKIIIK